MAKKTKKTLKVKDEKKSFKGKNFLNPFLIFALFLSLLLVYFFTANFKNLTFNPKSFQPNNAFISSRNQAGKTNLTKTVRAAVPSASANGQAVSNKPTIPQNYGRSVQVPILTYHYIGNNPNPADKARDNLLVSPDKFEEQVAYIAKNGYSSISFDTLYAALRGQTSLPSKPVILTFDDGYIDFYVNAFPILRKYGVHAVSFIPTGLMNQGYYLLWSQIKEMDATGLISFQAHSVNHLNLASLDRTQMDFQLKESKRVLEAELGKTVNTMAYPYGGSSPLVWQAVKEAGYVGAVGTWVGSVESEGNIFDMPRIKIAGSWSLEEFARRI